MPTIAEALDALDGAEPIRTLVKTVVEQSPALLFPTTARHYVAVVPEDGAQVALYAERQVLALAMDPARSEHYAAALEVPFVKKTPQTWYLRIPAAVLRDPDRAAIAHTACLEALDRCRDRLVADRQVGRVTARPDPGICLSCNMTLLPSGACGTDTCV
jgi:hypothetical protein